MVEISRTFEDTAKQHVTPTPFHPSQNNSGQLMLGALTQFLRTPKEETPTTIKV